MDDVPDDSAAQLVAYIDEDGDELTYYVGADGDVYDETSVDLGIVDQQGVQERLARAALSMLTLYGRQARGDETADEEQTDDVAEHTAPG